MIRPLRKPTKRMDNPFNKLYLSEVIDDLSLYSEWFSPTLLRSQADSIFARTNTIVRGSNGIGKTMLLRLISPQARAAYLEAPGDFEYPQSLVSTVGVEVNFQHGGFGSLGHREVNSAARENAAQWAFLFSDLLNYYIVDRLLDTLQFLKGAGNRVADEVNAQLDDRVLDQFAVTLARKSCWFGGLPDVRTFGGLKEQTRRRIEQYAAFVNWNTDHLGEAIQRSKTSIGQPVLAAREAMVESGLVTRGVALVVTLDQYESLYHVDYGMEEQTEVGMGQTFCRVVNSLLALRSPAVFFKIGVRPYAWGRERRGLNTEQRLEHERDYELVDLDELLRRSEHPGSWIFPEFAADVVTRRIAATLDGKRVDYVHWFEDKLEHLTAEKEVQKYARSQKVTIQEKPDEKWPPAWRAAVEDLYGVSRFRGRLAETWVRQQLRNGRDLAVLGPRGDGSDDWEKEWWRKERREAVLTQIASECKQRKLYAGWQTLLTLSGANILILINLCREIWNQWERAQSRAHEPIAEISADLQAQAVRIVASGWLNKQSESPRGGTRREFVERLGIAMRKAIISDDTLSYPGHNGFSLLETEWKEDQVVRTFLEGAEDYGALVGFPHTTKERDKRRRRKWYLAPILCPNFEIPAIRTKEPYYARIDEVKEWIANRDEQIKFRARRKRRVPPPSGRGLFGETV